MLCVLAAHATARSNPSGTKKAADLPSDDKYIQIFGSSQKHFQVITYKLAGMLPSDYSAPAVEIPKLHGRLPPIYT
jgi:hypothetical protein